MPLVRIALRKGTTPAFRHDLGRAVYQAMREELPIPENDHFQIVTEHDAEGLVYDPTYLGIDRTDGIVILQITISVGRTVEVKQKLYANIVRRLRALGVRPEDVFINLVEVEKANWSFGNGIAQYVA